MVKCVSVTIEIKCLKGAMWITSRDLRPCEGTGKRKQGKCTSFLFWGPQKRHELKRRWSWDK